MADLLVLRCLPRFLAQIVFSKLWIATSREEFRSMTSSWVWRCAAAARWRKRCALSSGSTTWTGCVQQLQYLYSIVRAGLFCCCSSLYLRFESPPPALCHLSHCIVFTQRQKCNNPDNVYVGTTPLIALCVLLQHSLFSAVSRICVYLGWPLLTLSVALPCLLT